MNMTTMHQSVLVNAANKWCLNEFGESFEAPVTELQLQGLGYNFDIG